MTLTREGLGRRELLSICPLLLTDMDGFLSGNILGIIFSKENAVSLLSGPLVTVILTVAHVSAENFAGLFASSSSSCLRRGAKHTVSRLLPGNRMEYGTPL